MSFEARYPGECGDCEEKIKPGHEVEYRDNWLCHVACASVESSGVRATEVCTSCWQARSLAGTCGCL